MSRALSATLAHRWLHGDSNVLGGYGQHVGDARPTMRVQIRRGYLKRKRRSDGWWTCDWIPTTPYKTIPGVSRCLIEQSFDSNGVATCTLDVANVAYVDQLGAAGAYHRLERGWFSPYRSYRGATITPLDKPANEWGDIFSTAAQVTVEQGYGDEQMTTFTGLLDSVTGNSQPLTLTLVARDFGQLLTDCRMFGWNLDPNNRAPTHFYDREAKKKLAERWPTEAEKREKWWLIDDISDMVRTVCIWAGLPSSGIRNTGAPLEKPVVFGQGEYRMDVIRKVQDVTGYVFFMAEPTDGYPLGRPILRRSNVTTGGTGTPVLLDERQLLTGVSWQHSDEPLASIIRVRGKPLAEERGGITLGEDLIHRAMGVYRPPWYLGSTTPVGRMARILRHVVHYEAEYTTPRQCLAAAMMIALQEALAATTATIELPAHPGVQLDDIVTIRDSGSGLASRAYVATKQHTFEAGAKTSWRMSLGVSLMDTPDVVQVTDDLGPYLTTVPEPDPVPPNQEEIEVRLPPPHPNQEEIDVVLP